MHGHMNVTFYHSLLWYKKAVLHTSCMDQFNEPILFDWISAATSYSN
jgi:hypothetical protein